MDFRRAVCTWKFVIAVTGYAILLVLNIPADVWPEDFFYVFSFAYSPGFYMFFPLCASIPYAAGFLADEKDGYMKHLISRVDIKMYSLSRCISVAASGFLAVVFATILFVVYLRVRFPISDDFSISYSGWNTMIQDGKGMIFIVIKTLMTATCGSSFAVIALVASTRIKNTFFVLALPTLLYYAWNEITFIVSVPLEFDLVSLFNVPVWKSYSYSLLYFSGLMCLISVIAGSRFYVGVRRLKENGYCA